MVRRRPSWARWSSALAAALAPALMLGGAGCAAPPRDGCGRAPTNDAHAGDGTSTYDAPGQGVSGRVYAQFVFDARRPVAEQLPVRLSSAAPNDATNDRQAPDLADLDPSRDPPAGRAPGSFEPSYLVYQLRASRQDIAREPLSGMELGSHVGMGIVRRQVRLLDAGGARDEGVLARSRRPRDHRAPLAWPRETDPAGRLSELVPGEPCDRDPNLRVLFMNNHGGALRYRYFDWDRSRLGAVSGGHARWGGPRADTSACRGGVCDAIALYKASAREQFHAGELDDTKADSSKIIAEAFVPLAHDPFAGEPDERLRARAELRRVEWMDRCLAFRPLRDDRWTYRRGAGVSGFCDALCGFDAYTIPGGLSYTAGALFRGSTAGARRARYFTGQDSRGDTIAFDPAVGYHYAGRLLQDFYAVLVEGSEESRNANYPAWGHNSNLDAEAELAMFEECAEVADPGGTVEGEPLDQASRWAAFRVGAGDEDEGSMAARIVSPSDDQAGVAGVCESVCRRGSAGGPTPESGWRNGEGIWTAVANAAFASGDGWPADELSNVIWAGEQLRELWETRHLSAYEKRVGGVTSGPFLLDNEQAREILKNPLAGHFAYRRWVHALDPSSRDDSGFFLYKARATPWAGEAVGPLAWHPMRERTYYDYVFQAVMRPGQEPDAASAIWISNDGDLTGPPGSEPLAGNPFLSSDYEVRACQLFIGHPLPVAPGVKCKVDRGM